MGRSERVVKASMFGRLTLHTRKNATKQIEERQKVVNIYKLNQAIATTLSYMGFKLSVSFWRFIVSACLFMKNVSAISRFRVFFSLCSISTLAQSKLCPHATLCLLTTEWLLSSFLMSLQCSLRIKKLYI